MIEVYKILHGLYDSTTTKSLFTYSTSNTRGHALKLTKESFGTTVYQKFFTNRIINAWNSLPESIVLSGTLNIFKNALDKYWVEYMFTSDQPGQYAALCKV